VTTLEYAYWQGGFRVASFKLWVKCVLHYAGTYMYGVQYIGQLPWEETG